MVRRLISLLAIIIGLAGHGRFLVTILADGTYSGQNWGVLVIPAYSFLTSLAAYGVLGLFDLNKIKKGKVFFWMATILSTLTLLAGGIYMPIMGYFIAGMIFLVLITLPFMAKKNVNLNTIILTINIMSILVSPFLFAPLFVTL